MVDKNILYRLVCIWAFLYLSILFKTCLKLIKITLSLSTTVKFCYLTLWEENPSVFKYTSLELCTRHYICYGGTTRNDCGLKFSVFSLFVFSL